MQVTTPQERNPQTASSTKTFSTDKVFYGSLKCGPSGTHRNSGHFLEQLVYTHPEEFTGLRSAADEARGERREARAMDRRVALSTRRRLSLSETLLRKRGSLVPLGGETVLQTDLCYADSRNKMEGYHASLTK
ncbi:hypothetical protein CRUP_003088 [Coryphaenoides rupestris]|nr:hypothetical protein CRUP_003088 [Coryphaenoides rupestris]